MSGLLEVCFTQRKNCVCEISSGVLVSGTQPTGTVHVRVVSRDSTCYLSALIIDTKHKQGRGKLSLNGLYATKLGLAESSIVQVEVLENVAACSRAAVEPVSVDDWEILELNAEFIQSNMMNQIRIVWNGAVLPLWITPSICLFVKVDVLEPADCECYKLEQLTELLIVPKERRSNLTVPNKNTQTDKISESSELLKGYNKPKSAKLPQTSEQNVVNRGEGSWLTYIRQWWDGTTPLPLDNCGANDIRNQPTSNWCQHRHIPTIRARVEHTTFSHLDTWWSSYPNVCVVNESFITSGGLPHTPFLAQISLLLSPLEIEAEAKNTAKLRRRHHKQPLTIKTERLIGTIGVCFSNNMRTGHVLLDDKFMRLHQITQTSRIKLESVRTAPSELENIQIQPLHSLPEFMNEDLMLTALRRCVDQISELSTGYPLVLLTSTTITIPITRDEKADFLLLLGGKVKEETESALGESEKTPYYLISNESLTKSRIHAESTVTHRCTFNITPQYMIQSMSLVKPRGFGLLYDQCVEFVHSSLQCRTEGALLLCGTRGSGKTKIVSSLLSHMYKHHNCYTHKLDSRMLRGKRPDAMKRLFDSAIAECIWRQPSILLIEDLETLCKAPTGPEEEASPEIIYSSKISEVLKDCLAAMWSDSSAAVTVICTCSSRNALHSKLTPTHGSHIFHVTEEILPLGEDSRREILEASIADNDMRCELSENDIVCLCRRLEGYVARDIACLVRRASHAHTIVCKENPALYLSVDDLEAALTGFTPASIRGIALHTPGDNTWKDVGGLSNIKSQLVRMLEWPAKYRQLYSQSPIRLQSGVLLYGAPGTGKTLVASVVAKEMGLNFISVKGPELLNKYIGASEQAVRDTFNKAQSVRPCILFFDEFDSLAPRRGHDSTGVTDRVVNQLLTQLDGVESLEGVYVMAATSRPDLIDPALLRPGRLDKSLCCDIPSANDRVQILQALASRMLIDDEVDLRRIAAQCDNCTGADLKSLLVTAQLEAVHDVMNNHIYNTGSVTFVRSPDRNNDSKEIEGVYSQFAGEGPQPITPLSPCYSQVQRLFDSEIVSKSKGSVTQSGRGDEPVTSSVVLIQQRHLQQALLSLQPSVSVTERRRYKLIYEQFCNAKATASGGQPDQMVLTKQRATLA